jgi:trehalose 6-phosphate phosphatase
VVQTVQVPATLAELTRAPDRAAVLLDVDGTLAPIVARPEDARVPDETRSELRRLAARYALVACISGRPGDDAKRIVGLDELLYVGEHGLELEPEAEAWAGRMREFADSTPDWEAERKRLTLSYHWREAGDPAAAVAILESVAERARAAGLVPRWGRKVLELRPPIGAHKGTAVLRVLTDRRLERALYAGDDVTDLDAFRALEALELGVRVAVASREAPYELTEAADLVVEGPSELLTLLRKL